MNNKPKFKKRTIKEVEARNRSIPSKKAIPVKEKKAKLVHIPGEPYRFLLTDIQRSIIAKMIFRTIYTLVSEKYDSTKLKNVYYLQVFNESGEIRPATPGESVKILLISGQRKPKNCRDRRFIDGALKGKTSFNRELNQQYIFGGNNE